MLLLLLFVNVLLILVTSWNYSIMNKLKNAENIYNSSDEFLNACQVSKNTVNVGKISSIIILILSILFMIFISVMIVKSKK
jgi:hypothetical protein